MSSATDLFLKELEPKAEPYDVSAADNLVLTVMPDGEKIWTLVEDQGGEARRHWIGIYPEMTSEEARERVIEKLGQARPTAEESWTNEKSDPLARLASGQRHRRAVPWPGVVSALIVVAGLFGALWYFNFRTPLPEPVAGVSPVVPVRQSDEATALPAEPETPPATLGSAAPAHVGQQPQVADTTHPAVPTPPVSQRDAGLILPRVSKAYFTSGIRDGEPVDRLGESLTAPGDGALEIFYFTELRHMTGEVVRHRWEYEGRIVAEVPFAAAADWIWQIHSSIKVAASQAGRWRVTVVNSRGESLDSDELQLVTTEDNTA